MRNTWIGIVGLALLVGGGRELSAQQIQVSPTNRTIAVTTTENAERRADTAVVHIGYQLYGPSSDAVTEAASRASNAIVDAEKKLGVAPTSIESDGQSTGPVPEYQENGQTPEEKANRKFQAQQSWAVKASSADVEQVLAAAVAAGANQSGAVDWSVADEGSLSAEAAGKALKHAQEIAEQMAQGLGAKLGLLVYASNVAESMRTLPLAGRGEAMMVLKAAPAAQAVKLSLSAPMVTRSATVSAVFSIQ
jgi:uncharacterized protein YggE